MDNQKHSIFMYQQTPTDYSCLENGLKCLPCNLDGLTERNGRFLLMELKHGEEISGGQWRMLKALAALPTFTTLIVTCKRTATNEKGGRSFLPAVFDVLDASGAQSETYVTNVEDFRARYFAWLKMPSDGALPFTLRADEWKLKYSTVVSPRELEAVQYAADMQDQKVPYKLV
jgi:hypothetical protein